MGQLEGAIKSWGDLEGCGSGGLALIAVAHFLIRAENPALSDSPAWCSVARAQVSLHCTAPVRATERQNTHPALLVFQAPVLLPR